MEHPFDMDARRLLIAASLGDGLNVKRIGLVGRVLLMILVIGGGPGVRRHLRTRARPPVDVVKVEPMGAAGEPAPLSPGAQAKAAKSAVVDAAASCEAQAEALQNAKREKDIILATCLDDKLSQCSANLQNIKRRQASLDEAIAKGDSGAATSRVDGHRRALAKVQCSSRPRTRMRGPGPVRCRWRELREPVDLFAPDENPAVLTEVPDWPIPFIPPPVG